MIVIGLLFICVGMATHYTSKGVSENYDHYEDVVMKSSSSIPQRPRNNHNRHNSHNSHHPFLLFSDLQAYSFKCTTRPQYDLLWRRHYGSRSAAVSCLYSPLIRVVRACPYFIDFVSAKRGGRCTGSYGRPLGQAIIFWSCGFFFLVSLRHPGNFNGFASRLRYCTDVAQRTSTKLHDVWLVHYT